MLILAEPKGCALCRISMAGFSEKSHFILLPSVSNPKKAHHE